MKNILKSIHKQKIFVRYLIAHDKTHILSPEAFRGNSNINTPSS